MDTAPIPADPDGSPLLVQQIKKFTVAEVRLSSLMDPLALAAMEKHLVRLVEEEDRRRIILDFSAVEYLSSQALGIILSVQKKLQPLSGKLVLCGVNAKLLELLKITRLDRILIIRDSQQQAINVE